MKRLSMGLLVALAACGSEGGTSFVWGDAVEPLAQDWCDMWARCFGAGSLEQCVRHNRHHLCELEDTCEEPIENPDEAALLCVEALQAIDGPEHPGCIASSWGIVPAECEDLLDLKP